MNVLSGFSYPKTLVVIVLSSEERRILNEFMISKLV